MKRAGEEQFNELHKLVTTELIAFSNIGRYYARC